MKSVARILTANGLALLVGSASLEASAEPVAPARQYTWQERGILPGHWVMKLPNAALFAVMTNAGLVFDLYLYCPDSKVVRLTWLAGYDQGYTEKDCTGQINFIDVRFHKHPIFLADLPLLAQWHYDVTVANLPPP